jgi:hypothetical protein
MIHLDPTPLTDTNVKEDLNAAHHLIVLVPADINYSTTTRRIWELANSTGMHVQLYGLRKDRAEEPRVRRELVSMASLLQDGGICAEVNVCIGTNWLDVARVNYKPGDVIVCFAEQRTGFLQKPLSQILESNFKATVYILSDLAPQTSKPNRLLQISAWLGSIGIVIGFGILQANVVQLPQGWTQSALLVLSIVPEFWLIWFWNSLFG